MPLDAFDRDLIAATQGGLPLVARPYEAVGAMLGVSGERVRARLGEMLNEGLVRRIGAVPNHYKLGFVANGMSVWDVDDALVDTLGEQVGALEGVSHCYRRPRSLPKATPGRSQVALPPLVGGATHGVDPGGEVCWPYNLFAMLHGRSRDEVRAQAERIARLLGPACRGHDILYSTAILKKTGLRLTTES